MANTNFPMAVLPRYRHVLSQKSILLGRDTFIFSHDEDRESEKLLIGLNQAVTNASGATLHRWLGHFSTELDNFRLCPVRMERCTLAPLALQVEEGTIGDPVDLNVRLGPGEYVWTDGMCDTPSLQSFAKLEERYHKGETLARAVRETINLYEVSDGSRHTILERDRNVCFMTGRAGPVDVWWIFPPTWGYMIEKGTHPQNFNHQRFRTEDNMVSMHKRLITDFHDNAFGIDVDDDYRIVRFRPLKGGIALPERLPTRPNGHYSRFDPFLRLHFDWCIQVNLFGGDTFTDYEKDMDNLMQDLGVNLYTTEHNLQKEDKRWSTVLGQGILEMLVLKRVVTEEEALTFGPSEHKDLE